MLDNQGYTHARPCTCPRVRAATRTHAHTDKYIIRIYLNGQNGFVNAPQYHVMRTLPVLLFVLTTHKTNNHAPGGIFFFSLCIYSYFCVLIILSFAFFYYSTTHTTKTFMSPAGFEPAIPASERPLILTHYSLL
jgi:hypothetical protein